MPAMKAKRERKAALTTISGQPPLCTSTSIAVSRPSGLRSFLFQHKEHCVTADAVGYCPAKTSYQPHEQLIFPRGSIQPVVFDQFPMCYPQSEALRQNPESLRAEPTRMLRI